MDLYKFVFPPDCPSLAVIGLIQPIGSLAPISELQSRWVAAVFSGQIKLPSKTEMLADIEYKRELRMKRFRDFSKVLQKNNLFFLTI